MTYSLNVNYIIYGIPTYRYVVDVTHIKYIMSDNDMSGQNLNKKKVPKYAISHY